MNRDGRPFWALTNTTAPSFNSTAGSAPTAYALESSTRFWQAPANRSVRVVNVGTAVCDYSIKFGTSTVVAASSDSMLIKSGISTVFHAPPQVTYISVMSSTTLTLNVTLGMGW